MKSIAQFQRKQELASFFVLCMTCYHCPCHCCCPSSLSSLLCSVGQRFLMFNRRSSECLMWECLEFQWLYMPRLVALAYLTSLVFAFAHMSIFHRRSKKTNQKKVQVTVKTKVYLHNDEHWEYLGILCCAFLRKIFQKCQFEMYSLHTIVFHLYKCFNYNFLVFGLH